MAAVRKSVTFTPTAAATSPAVLPHTFLESSSTKNQKNGHVSSSDGPTALNATNFKYLKHVLLKFMTSTEDEVRVFHLSQFHSIRVIIAGDPSDPCRINSAQFLIRRRTSSS
jgi:hypothetical protein